MTAFLAALKWAWALISPWAGRGILKLLPWLLPVVPWLKAMKPALIGCALVAVFAAVWWIARPDERLTVGQAKQVCEDANTRAELAATKRALEAAQVTLRLRSIAIGLAEDEIEGLRQEMEALRAAAPDPDAPVFAADDPWLRDRAR